MQLVVIGASHKTAPVEIREKFSLISSSQEEVITNIKGQVKIKEGVILSTCNRTEIYLVVSDNTIIDKIALKVFKSITDLNVDKLQEYTYVYQGVNVGKHLYKVISSLDSLVVGEDQILGQVKEAFQQANKNNLIGSYLHNLFTNAFRVGKRVRAETNIGAGATSVSYAAVELAKEIFGTLSGETVLILGAGETSELTLKSLVDHGVKGVMVSNRTYTRGQKLAAKFSGEVVKWDMLEKWIQDVDIIISSTAAPHYVLHYDQVKKAMEHRRGPLFLIDIAVPRDIEAEISGIPGVHLYDIDDLEEVIEKNISHRKDAIEDVKNIITEETTALKKWLNEQQVIPMIKKMRAEAEKIKEEELTKALKDLNQQKDAAKIMSTRINRLTNKLLHYPTVKIKELSNHDQFDDQALELIKELFSIK
ncbi:glutamyl-tRNA reductase [Halobacteroides halobius DSM 5150]|uniref:Glutamyl-tRNA reductase n=1 Tax=Halobacteroides halobius (strain ATCC 35273 / DSM 5150 / MD-1) TaxID=748449 RepID=L0K9I5_HALHC|nr:glutamyl-tRNA reductase [Halobacteroides halobius]AGB41200.1 glutamyl-tRNA reductase [Halobacteroides halobius DSM 5150]